MSKKRIDRDAILNASRAMATKAKPVPAPTRPPVASANSDRTSFKHHDLYEQIRTQREAAKLLGVTDPYFIEQQGRASATTCIDGKEVLNFASYDYLGLNGAAEVQAAAIEAIGRYGTSVSGSRPTSGERPFHHALEADLAKLYGCDAALVFVSGHATNVSTIGELLGSADLVLYDGFSHNSVVTGCKLSGATRKTFKHNDFNDLERILSQERGNYQHVMIIIEGLYSMDGDMPDLARAIEIKERYDAWLMVDEAHSLGVLGATGKGLFEQQSIDPRKVDIWMGTMSKTLSGCGGYICGSQELIDILKFFASGFMYSVGLSAPLATAAHMALTLMQQEPWRVEKLQSNSRYFLDHARAAGLDTGLSAGFCIIPVIVGDSLRAVKLANNLLARGVFAFPAAYPAVPMHEARLRFFITAEHSEDQLQMAIDIIADELRKLEEEGFSLETSLTGLAEVH